MLRLTKNKDKNNVKKKKKKKTLVGKLNVMWKVKKMARIQANKRLQLALMVKSIFHIFHIYRIFLSLANEKEKRKQLCAQKPLSSICSLVCCICCWAVVVSLKCKQWFVYNSPTTTATTTRRAATIAILLKRRRTRKGW